MGTSLASSLRSSRYSCSCRLGRRLVHQWTMKVDTPLDRMLDVSVAVSRMAPFEVTLLSPDKRATLARGTWIGPKERQLRYTICGERAFAIRVRSRSPLTVSARVTTP